jgi:CheY-like chemotaxis protein
MKRILVIDDDLETRTVIEILLKERDYIVEGISKWQYLTYSIQYFKPDLILMDVDLSGADGREICQQLKTSKKTRHIPIILFSGYPDLKDHLNGCVPDAVIEKPLDLNNLLETISGTLVH